MKCQKVAHQTGLMESLENFLRGSEMELVYIGEEHAMHFPALIKPFQHRETGKQYSWMDVSAMAALGEVKLRPATTEEMAAAAQHFSLISASLAYLGQFMDEEAQ